MNKRTTMKKREVSRRSLLVNSVSGLSTVMLVSHSPGTLAARQSAPRTVQSGQPNKFAFFSPAQAAEVEAVAAQIIPSGTPERVL